MSEVELNTINTDLSHYNLDDVLNLLNIDIKSSLPLVDFIVIPIVYPYTITIKNMVKI